MKNTLWMIRDEDGSLSLYNNFLDGDIFFEADALMHNFGVRVNPKLFPEVTVENSPQLFELKNVPRTDYKKYLNHDE